MEAFSLTTPSDIDGALVAASGPDAKFIAGGTDLILLMKSWVERPKRLVDIDGLSFDCIE
jgi:xanthine dehydrogenase YagS FAD-binding subunit